MRSIGTEQSEATGIRVVSQIVRERWGCRWQELDARNDDGIDGIIFLSRKSEDIGCHVFAQVKCGAGYRRDVQSRPAHITLNLGTEYIQKHIPRWNSCGAPVVLIYVDPTTDRTMPHAWWADLKASNSFPSDAKSRVVIPLHQRFFDHSKGDFIRLCGFTFRKGLLPVIKLNRKEVLSYSFQSTLKENARRYYQKWANSPVGTRTSPAFGVVDVSRVGWRHICLKRRGLTRITQSWMLLGAASRIVNEVDSPTLIRELSRTNNGSATTTIHHIGLRAKVIIPQRTPAIVEVILLRRRVIDANGETRRVRTWFYSVHELPDRALR